MFVWCWGTFVYTAGAAGKMWESVLLRMHISASCEQKHLRLPANEKHTLSMSGRSIPQKVDKISPCKIYNINHSNK